MIWILVALAVQTTGPEWLSIALRESNDIAALSAYQKAIHSDQLNLPGRTLAYWNMFLLNRWRPGQGSATADNLFSFIVTAETLTNFVEAAPEHPWSGFYRGQHVKINLGRAHCMLDHYWGHRDVRVFSSCLK